MNQAALDYIANNVPTWPDGPTEVAVDPDGEIRFDGTSSNDFYPDSRTLGLANCIYGGKLDSEYRTHNAHFTKAQWQEAREAVDNNGWILVTERLPDTVGSYLVYGELSEPEIFEMAWAFFNSNKDWCEPNGYFTEKVSHWRPLPKPPIARAKSTT